MTDEPTTEEPEIVEGTGTDEETGVDDDPD